MSAPAASSPVFNPFPNHFFLKKTHQFLPNPAHVSCQSSSQLGAFDCAMQKERWERGNAISFPRSQITALFLLLPTEEFSLHQTSLMRPDLVPDEYTLDILLPRGRPVAFRGNGEYSRGHSISRTATTGMKACSLRSHFASHCLLALQHFHILPGDEAAPIKQKKSL